jgi:predicted site-specific integrase-resolvase
MAMSGKLLTYEDLSERWQLAINTLRQWVMKGILIPIKLGRAVRFKESYIEELENTGFLSSNSSRR